MDLLQARNLTSHTYDEQKASEMEILIQGKYFPLLKELQNYFQGKFDEELTESGSSCILNKNKLFDC